MIYRWSVPVSVASWGEAIVVYHQYSGETYLFDGTSKDVLNFCIASVVFSEKDVAGCFQRLSDSHQADIFIGSLLETLIQNNLIVVEGE